MTDAAKTALDKPLHLLTSEDYQNIAVGEAAILAPEIEAAQAVVQTGLAVEPTPAKASDLTQNLLDDINGLGKTMGVTASRAEDPNTALIKQADRTFVLTVGYDVIGRYTGSVQAQGCPGAEGVACVIGLANASDVQKMLRAVREWKPAPQKDSAMDWNTLANRLSSNPETADEAEKAIIKALLPLKHMGWELKGYNPAATADRSQIASLEKSGATENVELTRAASSGFYGYYGSYGWPNRTLTPDVAVKNAVASETANAFNEIDYQGTPLNGRMRLAGVGAGYTILWKGDGQSVSTSATGPANQNFEAVRTAIPEEQQRRIDRGEPLGEVLYSGTPEETLRNGGTTEDRLLGAIHQHEFAIAGMLAERAYSVGQALGAAPLALEVGKTKDEEFLMLRSVHGGEDATRALAALTDRSTTNGFIKMPVAELEGFKQEVSLRMTGNREGLAIDVQPIGDKERGKEQALSKGRTGVPGIGE